MKKNRIIFLSLLFFTFIGSAQNKVKINLPQEQMALSSKVKNPDPDFLKQINQFSKKYGDTLYYNDFSNAIPTGWSVVNNNTTNNFEWVWNTVYQNGQFSAATNVITSTTAANGFMALTGDFFNTPISPTGAVAMDTYFESDSIDLTKNGTFPNGAPNVWVSYQQTFRSCCTGGSKRVLQVSSDNFATFQEYSAINTLASSGTITNVININSAILNATHIKIRFLSQGFSHYYWMIDDFAIIEGPANDVALGSPDLGFNYSYEYNPFYRQIPYDLFPPLQPNSLNRNIGGNNSTNLRLDGDFVHIATVNGTPGLGLVFNTSSTPITLSPNQTDTAITNSPYFTPTTLGDFKVDMQLNSDSIDEKPIDNFYSQSFSITDTIFARDDNGYGGGTGPGSYVRNGQIGGQTIGDKFGTMYIVESRTGNGGSTKSPSSITFAVSDDPDNIGVEIVPQIWSYEEDSLFTAGTIDAAFAGGVVATSFIPYTIQASDTNTLLTLPLDNGSAVFNGLDSGQYVVGWEVTNTNGGNSFEVYEDASSGLFQNDVTCFIDMGHQPGWGWVNANPVIRLNFPPPPLIGIKESQNKSIQLSILPNPNNGLFTINVSTQEAIEYKLIIRNALGQEVYTNAISVNGIVARQIDLTKFDKGIYLISIESETDKISKRIVVK